MLVMPVVGSLEASQARMQAFLEEYGSSLDDVWGPMVAGAEK
ncbi:MAG: hypothetical protein R3E50_16015 [Halioglobus sp.]